MRSYNICVSVSGLFCLAQYPPVLSMLLKMAALPSFSRLNNISPSVKKHCDFFHVSAIANTAGMNTTMQRSLRETGSRSFGGVPRSGIAGSQGSSIFNFLKYILIVFYDDCFNFCSHQQYVKLFSISSSILVLFYLFGNSHPNKCDVTPHCGFDFHFPDDYLRYPVLDIWFTNVFSHSLGSLFTLFTLFCAGQKHFSVTQSFCLFLLLLRGLLGYIQKNYCPNQKKSIA